MYLLKKTGLSELPPKARLSVISRCEPRGVGWRSDCELRRLEHRHIYSRGFRVQAVSVEECWHCFRARVPIAPCGRVRSSSREDKPAGFARAEDSRIGTDR